MAHYWINADDFGANKSVNSAILKAFSIGTIQSTSVISNLLTNQEIKLLKNLSKKGLKVNLHLNLVQGRILSKDLKSVWQRKTFPSKIDWMTTNIKIDKKLISEEFEVQFSILESNKIPVNGIDFHCLFPIAFQNVWPVYLNFAKSKRLPYRGTNVSFLGGGRHAITYDKIKENCKYLLKNPRRELAIYLKFLKNGKYDGSFKSDFSFFNNGRRIKNILKKIEKSRNYEKIELITHIADPSIPLSEGCDYAKGSYEEFVNLVAHPCQKYFS